MDIPKPKNLDLERCIALGCKAMVDTSKRHKRVVVKTAGSYACCETHAKSFTDTGSDVWTHQGDRFY